ncbi:SRPBCC family protein [Arsenicicoccus dermatophilus]|uniref:SRPBCC family protein n=1 Tax=Arsenicicoccus dermatophilus TaxID=1076331 RepID=UPI001F4CEC59|nr:hypothetical protein [Arsenicicoccus dermatophilus]MCH8611522.1 hypothetical protein [Arsenicicoccus dermatophilus]
MTAHHYRFEQVWQVPLPLRPAFEILRDVDGYDRWWPQVRQVQRVGPDEVRMTLRSGLPVALRVVLSRQVEDPDSGVLRVGLTGDLTGWAMWQLTWEGETTTAARWSQECDLTHPRLARLPAATRPAFELNHVHMMRAGEAGLRKHLQV